jgi:hypothetical protein
MNNQQLASGKIHYTGIPCRCDRRWSSCHLSSTGDLARVTCGNCRRIVTARDVADALAAPVGCLPIDLADYVAGRDSSEAAE